MDPLTDTIYTKSEYAPEVLASDATDKDDEEEEEEEEEEAEEEMNEVEEEVSYITCMIVMSFSMHFQTGCTATLYIRD